MRVIFSILISIFLVGCQTAPTSTKTIDANGNPVVTNQYQTQKTMLANSMNANVNQCLAAVKAKYDHDQKKLGERDVYVSAGSLSGDQMVALQLAKALENTFMATIEANKSIELARLGVPFSSSGIGNCSELGYAHLVIEKKRINHKTLNNIVPKVLKTALTAFGISEGRKYLLGTLDRVKANNTATEGGIVQNGNDNIYQPDNRVNNVGGTCAGELGPNGECIVPVEEVPEEPDPEEPVPDEPEEPETPTE